MAKPTDLAEAARLLSQAATSLINSPAVHDQRNVQTSNETSTGTPTTSTQQEQTTSERPARAREEFRRLFAPYSSSQASTASRVGSSTSFQCRTGAASTLVKPNKKRRKTKDVTVKFFCLSSTCQHDVRSSEEKQQLLVAGLGEKKVTLTEDANASDVRRILNETYPKLKDSGGYELLYAKPSSRELNVICEGEKGHTIDFLKRFVGQGRVYIRPIQCDLDLAVSDKSKIEVKGTIVEEICNSCVNIFPMNKLREHVCSAKRNDKNTSTSTSTTRHLGYDVEEIEIDEDDADLNEWLVPYGSQQQSNRDAVDSGPTNETSNIGSYEITHPASSESCGVTANPTSDTTTHSNQGFVDDDFDMMYASLLFQDINDGDLSDELVVEDEPTSHSLVSKEESLNINSILHELAVNIDSLSISKFNICRSDIWDGVLRGMVRKSFSPRKKISVKFTDDVGCSEGAVDMGGPMREFFTLAIEKVVSGNLFCGPELERFISLDARALKQDEYFYAGQLFSMSLVHCGIGPRCLSPILLDALVKGPSEVVVPVEAVYDPELRVSLQGLISAESVVKANEAIVEKKLDGLFELAGTLRLMRTLSDVKDVALETAHWYVLGRTRPAFESFKSGLSCLGLLNALLWNPQSFQQSFCFSEQALYSDTFENLFTVDRSEKESNRWEVENKLLGFWRDLLLDVEENDCEITFSDILFFASGLKVVPCRTINLQLAFLHDPEANGNLPNFPKANTCSCVLYLPVTHFKYNDFKTAFTFAVRNAKGFGHP